MGQQTLRKSEIADRSKIPTAVPFTVVVKHMYEDDQLVRKDLKPDALFGLIYHTDAGDRFRFFVVEADRGTEPVTSRNWNRKSFERHLAQYEAYVAGGEYKRHLNLTANLLVLNVVPDAQRVELMRRQLALWIGAGRD